MNSYSESPRKIFICSPLRPQGDTVEERQKDLHRNKQLARFACRYATERGYMPLAPHLYFPQFMDDNIISERNLALYMDIILLSKCAELWVFGDYISKGMSIEIAKAKKKNQPIRYFTVGCEEVRK